MPSPPYMNPLSMSEKLSMSARSQLVARAALFQIFATISEDFVELRIPHQNLNIKLPLETGLCRLVAELAEILTPWVIFSAGKPPERVLLQYTDVKYRKLVAAWTAQQKKTGLMPGPMNC